MRKVHSACFNDKTLARNFDSGALKKNIPSVLNAMSEIYSESNLLVNFVAVGNLLPYILASKKAVSFIGLKNL